MANSNRSIPVIVISGFLGAGKTSLVNHLLRTGFSDKRLAVIVNDFGRLSVDASLIRQQGPDVIELSNGCVCCSVQVGLLQAIDRVTRQHGADLIILECSGISDTRQLLNLFADPSIPAHVERVVTMVDARRFLRQHERFVLLGRQIEPADVLIVNHCDEADSATVKQTCELLQQLRPGAAIMTASHGQIDPEVILRQSGSQPAIGKESVEADTTTDDQSWYKLDIRFREPIAPDTLSELLAGLSEELQRAKGFLQWDGKAWCIQMSGHVCDVQPIPTAEWSPKQGVVGEMVLIADHSILQQVRASLADVSVFEINESRLNHDQIVHTARSAHTHQE